MWNTTPFSVPCIQGDVQMSVSALLVLGDKANGLISDQIIEQWFASYIGEFKPWKDHDYLINHLYLLSS